MRVWWFIAADDDSLSISPHLEITLGDGSFAQMQADPDRQRLLGERPITDPIANIIIQELEHQER